MMCLEKNISEIEKLATGIPGFDLIANGGLPKGRTTLVSGTAGSAKTVFAAQFLAVGIDQAGENGVFVTFEEAPDDIRQNMQSFGWNIEQWEAEGKWAFVDASHEPGLEAIIAGDYDLGALLARIEHAGQRVNAQRISIDSLGAVFDRFSDHTTIRSELFRVGSALKQMKVTAVMTAERTQENPDITRYGVEEFVTDNVLILRNVLENEKRRRTIEILKFRGASHQKGEFPFTIIPHQGLRVLPLSAFERSQESPGIRTTSGNLALDQMCGGGFFQDSIILISGATGTGKTLTAITFLAGGVARGERCLLFAFEESRAQLFRYAKAWNVDFEQMEKRGNLKVISNYPEATDLEDHLVQIMTVFEEFKPDRVVVDSLSALERAANPKNFQEFTTSLVTFIKGHGIITLFTSNVASLTGSPLVSELNVSTLTDAIILLRYVEIYGEIRRGLIILKMRGSKHDKDIREFSIDEQGLHIGKPFRNVTGILAGHPTYTAASELERLGGLFNDEQE